MLLSLKNYGYKNYRIEPLYNQVWARDFDIRISQTYILNNNAIGFFKIVLLKHSTRSKHPETSIQQTSTLGTSNEKYCKFSF